MTNAEIAAAHEARIQRVLRLVDLPVGLGLVEQRAKDIASGKHPVFAGPLVDQAGATRVRAGTEMPDTDKLKMNWLVKGVIGNLPQ